MLLIIKVGHSKIFTVRFFYDLFVMRPLLTAVDGYDLINNREDKLQ